MIAYEIPAKSNFEIIRDKIFYILLSEVENQVYRFSNARCSGATFYADRTVPIQKEESISINVSLFKGKEGDVQTVGTQDFDLSFFISIETNSPSTATVRGDKLASILCHRWIGIIRHILMHQDYITLGMPDGIIKHTAVTEFAIDIGLEKTIDSSNNSTGYLIFGVDTVENTIPNEGVLFGTNETNVYIELTDRGYEYKLTPTP